MPATGNKPAVLSVQIGLNGFSYQTDDCTRSPWLGAEFVFDTKVFQQRFDKLELYFFTPVFTLVPAGWFSPDRARELLSAATSLKDEDEVVWQELPQAAAVEIWRTDNSRLGRMIGGMLSPSDAPLQMLPEFHALLTKIYEVNCYNKIAASYAEGRLYLVIYQGRNLMLCNSFEAPDFTTAQYYIFLAMKKLQLNAEVSTIYFHSPISPEEEMSMYNYFKAVKRL